MEISIRDASADDAETIADYNNRMAEETEGKSLPAATVRRGVRRLLENPAHGRYWVAERAGMIAGQIMVTYEWSDWRDGQIWWVQSVYVPKQHRRAGVFTALYRHVSALAEAEADVCGIRLYVEKENIRAQQTYDALGMMHTHYRIMETMFARSDT
jgi:ribosomal protein S18 acetylase RimI-like enzyme